MNKAVFFVSPNGASVTNPDAGSTLDVFLFNFRTAIFNPQPARTGEWQCIKPFVYAKRFGEPSRAGDSFYSANQDCGRKAAFAGDDVQHIVHPVGEVHVDVPTVAKHDRV